MNSLIKITITFFCCVIFISSCAKEKKVPSAENSYIEAMEKLKDKDYTAAAEGFEKISDDFPLSKWGVKAQTMAAYSFYKEKNYDDVIRIAEDFNHNNPSNSNVAYMQYLKSLSYYEQMNDIQRAQDNAQAASFSLRELIARFPISIYSDDARDKLSLVDEHIAGAKMSVGRYQLHNQNYIGAIKNFQKVIDRYSRTDQTPEAYFRIFEAYKKIGLNQEAENYLKELNNIYPENKWSKKNN